MDRDQVAFANARTGVNVVICYSARRCDHLSSEHVLAVREKIAEAFRLAHSCYQLKELLCGPIGEEALHTLRKEYGSQINTRFGLTAAQEMLRHANIHTTAAHYVENKQRSVLGFGHLLKSNQRTIFALAAR